MTYAGVVNVQAIDDVVDRLTAVVERARHEGSRVGYFAAMYRKVTLAVRQAILDGAFENGERMVNLDVVFAERYLEAHDAWRAGKPMTEVWQTCFHNADRWRPLIIQHLLAGMSAHINLDLAVAAATVAPGAEIADLRNDFDTINDVLGGMIDDFTSAVGEVSPWIGWLDRKGGATDQTIVRFSIELARRSAWDLAEELAALDPPAWQETIDRRDSAAAAIGRSVLGPGGILPVGLFLIRLRETNDVRRAIDTLS